ncbi:hypothetical protein [Kutzneria sp. CA-103260]|uniref:hypothetical protein n=1 Tax=Kutzneria sp. CA-103260 TaxID=2802641 RepID=UPI001BACDDC2|nr:hypothetical protein [Kutzneria sp. CA-103260]QUQ68054.1 hypothetical protein JJ691_57940 [Kutzneria sp. CA-103260]
MTTTPRSVPPDADMTNARVWSDEAERSRVGRAARFAKACRPRLAVAALPVVLVCGQQFWWALVVAGVAAVIEVVRYLRSPPFMRMRLPAGKEAGPPDD